MNPVRPLKAQPRFFTAAAIGGLLWWLLPHEWRSSTRLLVAWDCATGLYLVLAIVMMASADIEVIRYRAALQDEGQLLILGLAAITALISLGGTMAEMAAAKAVGPHDGWRHLALTRSHRDLRSHLEGAGDGGAPGFGGGRDGAARPHGQAASPAGAHRGGAGGGRRPDRPAARRARGRMA